MDRPRSPEASPRPAAGRQAQADRRAACAIQARVRGMQVRRSSAHDKLPPSILTIASTQGAGHGDREAAAVHAETLQLVDELDDGELLGESLAWTLAATGLLQGTPFACAQPRSSRSWRRLPPEDTAARTLVAVCEEEGIVISAELMDCSHSRADNLRTVLKHVSCNSGTNVALQNACPLAVCRPLLPLAPCSA